MPTNLQTRISVEYQLAATPRLSKRRYDENHCQDALNQVTSAPGATRQDDQAGIPVRRESSIVQEVFIMSQENSVLPERSSEDILIAVRRQARLGRRDDVEPFFSQESRDSSIDIVVDQESRFLAESHFASGFLLADLQRSPRH